MPQPTSKPGQPGGNHGPTRPTYFPLVFSSTTNMPAPWSAQCPATPAALRHPTNSLVMGFPSTVMNRAVPGSASIAVFGATSVPRHCRRISRSVSITGPLDWASVTPGLRGAIIWNFHFHGRLSAILYQDIRWQVRPVSSVPDPTCDTAWRAATHRHRDDRGG